MPASPESLRLAERYRSQQLAVRAGYMREAVALWSVLDKARVGESSAQWLRLSIALIRRWRGPSSLAASRYYEAARLLDVGAGSAPPLEAPDMPDEQMIRALLHAGPGEMKRARLRGLTEGQSQRAGLAASSASGARLVVNAGRETVAGAVQADVAALGFLRVTDGNPCAFCAMLASRGAVYKTAESAGEVNKYHDSCGCVVVPVFTDTPTLPASSQRYANLWRTSTRGLSGDEARKAFRRAVDAH